MGLENPIEKVWSSSWRRRILLNETTDNEPNGANDKDKEVVLIECDLLDDDSIIGSAFLELMFSLHRH